MFKFTIGQAVVISLTSTPGKVTGRAEYDRHPNTYQINFVNGQGNAVFDWFDEQDLSCDEE